MRIIKSFILFSSFFVFTQLGFSQVGIGTTDPDASAMLDVMSGSKGVLINRVELTNLFDVTTIASPATGLLVYNTSTNGTAPNNVVPGFYYYDGSKWVSISFSLGTNINIQTGNYTLVQNDFKGVVIMNSATPVSVTVPTTLSKGFFCQIIQKGAGQVTVVGASGFTLNSAHGFKSRTVNSSIGVVLESSSLGYVSGDSTF